MILRQPLRFTAIPLWLILPVHVLLINSVQVQPFTSLSSHTSVRQPSFSTKSILCIGCSIPTRQGSMVLKMVQGKQQRKKKVLTEEEDEVRLPSQSSFWPLPFDLEINNHMSDNDNTKYMNEAKTEFLDEVKASEQGQNGSLKALFLVSSVSAVTYFLSTQHDSFPMNIIFSAQNLLSDPTATLESIVSQVETMGNLGLFYFGIFYTLAEVLAIPAFPLTASAGYLFGVGTGTAVVLLSASIAASASFLIGRTVLRPYVEGLLEKYPKFKAMDKVIGKEGFKLILLLRLSPLFPFALSNYLYGVTSVDFKSYFWGTLLGFLPGTVAYVYTGEVGKALTIGGGGAQPWYIYAGGLAVLAGGISVLSDIASKVVRDMEEFDDDIKE